jgi:hypothetical protein
VSKTVVEIVQDGTYRAAQPQQVLIAEGNTIQFSNQQSGGTLLVLTPETSRVLSPTPNSPVEIAGGASVSFEFLKPTGSRFYAQVLPEGEDPVPIDGPASEEGPILTILSSIDRGTDSRTGRGL